MFFTFSLTIYLSLAEDIMQKRYLFRYILLPLSLSLSLPSSVYMYTRLFLTLLLILTFFIKRQLTVIHPGSCTSLNLALSTTLLLWWLLKGIKATYLIILYLKHILLFSSPPSISLPFSPSTYSGSRKKSNFLGKKEESGRKIMKIPWIRNFFLKLFFPSRTIKKVYLTRVVVSWS